MTTSELYSKAASSFRAGDADSAERRCREVLALHPEDASTLNLLSTSMRRRGKLDEALGLSQRAVQIQADSWFFLFNLGDCCRSLGRLDEAIEAYEHSLRLERSPQVLAALGHAYTDKGSWVEAAESFRQSALMRPRHLGTLVALARALNHIPKPMIAADAARSALALDSRSPAAHRELAIAMRQLGELTASAVEFNKSLEPGPRDVEGVAALANIELERLNHGTALQLFREALNLSQGSPAIHGELLLALQYDPATEESSVIAEHRRWGAVVMDRVGPSEPETVRDRIPDRPLRVGYLSPDLREHPVSYFIEPVLRGHGSRECQPVIFDDAPGCDQVKKRLRELAPAWHETRLLDNQRLFDLIRRERIDILVDLAGHTSCNRLVLFARKPAPVQVSYLGYPNTTGLPAHVMGYRLTDPVADPPGRSDDAHTERLVRMPGCFLCYQPRTPAPDVRPLPADSRGVLTFGCFCHAPKVSRWLVELWAELLRRLADSRLMLKNRSLCDGQFRHDITARFAAFGIRPERLCLCGRSPTVAEHLSRYNEIDIALDSYPYGGTTTTCEALWMGVPVVTLTGAAHRSRVGASIMTAVGLPELIASSPAQYVQIAVELAQDAPRLRELRKGMRERVRHSPLTDGAAFTAKLESAYRAMWREHCSARQEQGPSILS